LDLVFVPLPPTSELATTQAELTPEEVYLQGRIIPAIGDDRPRLMSG
jgi:hypothetical protein